MTEQDYPYSMTQQNPSELVREWLKAFNKPLDQQPTKDQIQLAWSCINEETLEVFHELYDTSTSDFEPNTQLNKERLTKELCDLLWVTYQCAAFFGLPIDAAFSRVYYSNMSKLQNDGTPLLRDDGKILKSENYKPADLKDLFND